MTCSTRITRSLLGTTFASVAILAGCSSRPAAVSPVDVDPDDASRQAIELYDKDQDGALSDQELAAVPGIAKYKSLYDQDGDGAVTQAEIETRLGLWSEQGLGFRPLNVVVVVDGRPLADAAVEFDPEPYLGPNVKRATGTTDSNGMASLAVAVEDMPAELADLPIDGVMGGTFKVRVTHPSVKLPARFNTETELGEEIAFDTIRERATVTITTK
jgi:hypothetical protein